MSKVLLVVVAALVAVGVVFVVVSDDGGGEATEMKVVTAPDVVTRDVGAPLVASDVSPEPVAVSAETEREEVAAVDEAPRPADDVAELVADLNAAIRRLAVGDLGQDEVARLCEELLADLDALEIRDGAALLLETDALTARLLSHERRDDGTAGRYVLALDVASEPGQVSGRTDDGAARTRVDITLSPPRDDATAWVGTVAQADWRQVPEFVDTLPTTPTPIGGTLSVGEGTAVRRKLAIRPHVDETSGMAGVMTFHSEPDEAWGDARSPRFTALYARLDGAFAAR